MKKLLVVVDMQKDFVDGSLGTPEAVEIVPGVVEKVKDAKEEETDIVFTRDTHGEDYLKTQEGRKLPVVHTVKYTEGWEIQKDVMDAVTGKYKQEQIAMIDKPCFGSEELAERIGKLGQEYPEDGELTVDFVGVCTDICVISNVFLAKAAARNAVVRVIERACAGVTPETHRTAIEAMRGCQVEII